jgi:hypothetical protein
MSLKKNPMKSLKKSLKKNSKFNFMESDYNLLQRLKVDILVNTNLLDISDYNKNENYFKNNIFNKKNDDINRMWLIHLLAGEVTAEHFFKTNGDLNTNYEIEKKILKLLSWRGTELNDNYLYQKVYKKLYKSYGYFIKYMSQFKKIYFMIETFVYNFARIQDPTRKDLKLNIFILPSSFVLSILFNAISEMLNNRFKIFAISSINPYSVGIIIYIILNILNAIYTSYYFTIEQDHINKFLKEGLNDTHRIEINKFKELYYDFDMKVSELNNKRDSELIELIDKHYNSFFKSFLNFKKEHNLKLYLKQGLKNEMTINEFYKIIINILYIYPYALYFFKQNGSLRTSRECVCSIIYLLMNDDLNIKEKFKTSIVVKPKRQKNLL